MRIALKEPRLLGRHAIVRIRKNVRSRRSHFGGQKEGTSPSSEWLSAMRGKLLPNIFLMLDVGSESRDHVRVEVESTQAEVPALVAEEPGSLLQRIGIPSAGIPRHVRNRQP